ncbi:hypothetical protein [Desulfomarina profundi]|nr:hypothetical protein [Desulfomarina profundi]
MNRRKNNQILQTLLLNAKTDQYRGYNKHDGLLSPFLSRLLGGSRIPRLLAIQSLMRAPVNLRPLFGVPRSINPKGIGLFSHANLNLYAKSQKDEYRQEAENLLSWLIERGNTSFPGISWGYQYPWQDVGFFAPANFPNRVVTCWIGYAFFRAWELLGKEEYLDICKRICVFLRQSPNRIADTDTELCFSYVPDKKVTWAVMDVSALCGKLFALTGTTLNDEDLLADAARCMNWVINRQTPYHAWYYTDPPGDSHITHDNYHSGIILDCIADYMMTTGTDNFREQYLNGLEFYENNLFCENGAPKWMNNRVTPYDIHGAAQGIITFSIASRFNSSSLKKAEQILTWTLKNLYNHKTGNFWYQKNKIYTKKFTLLRWCNAWMARAISEFLATTGKTDNG